MTTFVEGQELGPLRLDVERETALAYAAASGDDNPIHQSDEAARAIGLPGVLIHGMWTMGAALRLVTAEVDPAAIRSTSCRFTKPILIPATLRVTGVVKKVVDGVATIAIEVVNETDDDARAAKLEVTVE